MNSFFYFTRNQRGGLIILVVVIILLIAGYFLLPFIVKNELNFNEDFKAEAENFRGSKQIKPEQKELSPFPFDPNTISKEKMAELGLTQYQAEMILKYREAGGRFLKKEDFSRVYSIGREAYETLANYIIISKPQPEPLPKIHQKQLTPQPFDPNVADSSLFAKIGFDQKQITQIINYRDAGGKFFIKGDFHKIYSISDDDFHVLENYILLPSVAEPIVAAEVTDSRKPEILIEINEADSLDLIKLRGIGPVFAHRILSYREKLGGFYHKSQLLEVFGLDTNRYFQFAHQVIADTSKVKKTDLNQVNFDELLRHPYFEYYMVKSIFDYKDAVGDFTTVDELKQVSMIYNQLYEKIRPYLMVDKNETSFER